MQKNTKDILSGCLIILGVLAAIGALVLLSELSGSTGSGTKKTASFAAGYCLRRPTADEREHQPPDILPNTEHAVPELCTDKRVFAKIIAVGGHDSDCPLDTDEAYDSFGVGAVCVRDLHGPHEGDVGGGGGLLRVGDCLEFARSADGQVMPSSYEEIECGHPTDAYHSTNKIVKAAQRISGCPHGTKPFAKEGAGVPDSAVHDINSDRDWPRSYPPGAVPRQGVTAGTFTPRRTCSSYWPRERR